MDFDFQPYQLKGIDQINVILGKNGCGKSTLLRAMETSTRNSGYVRYITPERGGQLSFDGNIETNLQNPTWASDSRRRNQTNNFRQISVSEFRRLETLVLRKIERDAATRSDKSITFDSTIGLINELLDSVEIRRSENGAFEVYAKGEDSLRSAEHLSSGESELISLGIEVLSFSYICEQEKYKESSNWLLFDEPDVHLHPDLQYRLMRLLTKATRGKPFKVLIATHSTAILGALCDSGSVKIAFMEKSAKSLQFERAEDSLKAVMPIFGAHPLSNVFNQRPIMLVEGEDDERIWQQACRTSHGAIRIWPCAAGDIQSMQSLEEKARSIIGSVYENAKAYSLRDRDDAPYAIEDLGPVVRARLACRAAENLLVTDDVLIGLGSNWKTLESAINRWIEHNAGHAQYGAALKFRDDGWNRRDADLKPLRNLIMALAGSQKPWEVAVGQSIAALIAHVAVAGEFSLTDFLGPKIVEALQLRPRLQLP